jgi:hypothetical protein
MRLWRRKIANLLSLPSFFSLPFIHKELERLRRIVARSHKEAPVVCDACDLRSRVAFPRHRPRRINCWEGYAKGSPPANRIDQNRR